jgi:hypothetical protein
VFGQKNYYKTFDNKILSETEFKSMFDVVAKNEREGFIAVPIIYHNGNVHFYTPLRIQLFEGTLLGLRRIALLF